MAKRWRGLDRQKLQFDIERLSEDVKAAYKAYTVDTIDKMWAYKSVAMKKIIECNGGNQLLRPQACARGVSWGGV